jgi:hypothetical protein
MFVLRRGLMYAWWEPDTEMVRFKNVTPEAFFPQYDGDEIYRAVYIQRRSTDALKDMYPDQASDILDDLAMEYPTVEGSDSQRVGAKGQTTVIDLYDKDGHFYRVMGNAFVERTLNFPLKKLPFIEFPCFPISGETEPENAFDQLVELNQYIDQLLSQ